MKVLYVLSGMVLTLILILNRYFKKNGSVRQPEQPVIPDLTREDLEEEE